MIRSKRFLHDNRLYKLIISNKYMYNTFIIYDNDINANSNNDNTNITINSNYNNDYDNDISYSGTDNSE